MTNPKVTKLSLVVSTVVFITGSPSVLADPAKPKAYVMPKPEAYVMQVAITDKSTSPGTPFYSATGGGTALAGFAPLIYSSSLGKLEKKAQQKLKETKSELAKKTKLHGEEEAQLHKNFKASEELLTETETKKASFKAAEKAGKSVSPEARKLNELLSKKSDKYYRAAFQNRINVDKLSKDIRLLENKKSILERRTQELAKGRKWSRALGMGLVALGVGQMVYGLSKDPQVSASVKEMIRANQRQEKDLPWDSTLGPTPILNMMIKSGVQ